MAHFARQKRQSRFYWAELGFMALGLLGLQPSLFINLIMGSQTKSNPFLSTLSNQTSDVYRDLPATHLASYYPAQPLLGLPSIAQGWPQYTPPSYGQNPTFGQPTYGQLTQSPFSQPYQQYNTSPQTLPTLGSYTPQHNYSTPSASNPHTPQYAQYSPTSPFASSNGGQNQPAYFAQANTGYSWPGAANSDQWSASQANNHSNRIGNFQTGAIYADNSNSPSGSYPYNALTPRSSPQSLFDSGYGSNNYLAGRANTASSLQTYGYPSSSAKPNAWQRYQPNSPMYR